jgi:dTDP-4-amino-4,6-dideoxygalactose transaminase
VVLSGNIPRFIDATGYDYNMDLDQVAEAINERTRMIVATHLFGYPLDIYKLEELVKNAEQRYGHKIWVLQDCAHAFGAAWRGAPVCRFGDAAFFGLNISKMMTSIFGGMLVTDNEELALRLRAWRDANFTKPGWLKDIRRRLYLLAMYPAFDERFYGLVYWLQYQTHLLDYFTRSYHLDEKIHFPPDYMDQMLDIEAQVGLTQLQRYDAIVAARRETARYYAEHLADLENISLPPLVDGATYSHYVIRVKERDRVMQYFGRRGVQLGHLIEYSIPHEAAYRQYAGSDQFANSLHFSQNLINLPIYAGLKESDREKVVRVMRSCFKAAG